MANDRTPFFRIDGGYVVGNDAARGPWSADACHAGPVAGLLARAAEQEVSDKQLVRLAANFLRPVPMAGVRIDIGVARAGRTATTLTMSMLDRDGKTCATAVTTHIVEKDVGELPTPEKRTPPRCDAEPQDFISSEYPHGKASFANFVETRYPTGTATDLGPKTVWMRTPELVEGEAMSPFQSVCPLADCGNGISFNRHPRDVSCINPDMTVVLHRPPESEWLASRAISHWESNGIGLAHATLFDAKGEIGAALQSLVLRVL